jgi:nitrite reductase (NADH) small subunit
MNPWTAVCRVEDIPVLGSRRVARQQGLDVAVFRNGTGEVFALLDRCPHKGGPLSQGIVFGTSVACPLHNWTIGLCTGQAAAPDEGCTPKFSIKLEDGVVYLDAHELATVATDLTRPVAGPAQKRPHAPPLRGSLPPEGVGPALGRPGGSPADPHAALLRTAGG